jgi:transposase-like protein
MNCPKCKEGEIKEQVSITGLIFKKKNVHFYCPLCDYQNDKEFKLSKEDVQLEYLERANTPTKKETIYTYRRGEAR